MGNFIEFIETLAHQQGWAFHLLNFILSCTLVVILGIRGYRIVSGEASTGSLFKNLINNDDDYAKPKEHVKNETLLQPVSGSSGLKAQVEKLLQKHDSSNNDRLQLSGNDDSQDSSNDESQDSSNDESQDSSGDESRDSSNDESQDSSNDELKSSGNDASSSQSRLKRRHRNWRSLN